MSKKKIIILVLVLCILMVGAILLINFNKGKQIGAKISKNNNIKIISGDKDTIGSEIAIGDEHFYVISSDDESVTMLAKYNLLVGKKSLVDETSCNEAGYKWIGTEDCTESDCNTYYGCEEDEINISPKTQGYNLQSPDVSSSECDSYNILNDNNSVIASYSASTKQAIFNAIDANDISSIECSNDSDQIIGLVEFYYNFYKTGISYWCTDETYPHTILKKYGKSYPAYVYDDNSGIKKYVDNYKTLLKDDYGINISEARLISYKELDNLGCDDNCYTKTIIDNQRTWLFDTSYWTGTAYDNQHIWAVGQDGNLFLGFMTAGYGVRPVITISKSEF